MIPMDFRKLYIYLKSAVDIVFAVVLCTALLPLFVLAALAIKIDSKGPLFYTQQRVGRHEKLFDVLKFRTMTVDENRDASQTLPGSSDVTRVGLLLRRTKFDELPQLLNILKGDMSLVGPRPCLPAMLETIEPQYRQRFHIKPGLTGLAQVNGNIYIDWEERFKFDVQYVQTMSPLLDLRILAKTVAVVGLGEKIFANTEGKQGKQ